MTSDNDTTVPSPELLAAIREAAKLRFSLSDENLVDTSVDDRQQPQPATLRNTHIHREAWLHAVAATLRKPFKTPWSSNTR